MKHKKWLLLGVAFLLVLSLVVNTACEPQAEWRRVDPTTGLPLEFDIHVPEYLSEAMDVAEMWKADCEEIGIELNIIPVDSDYLWDIMMVENEYAFDLSMWNWGGESPDPDFMLSVLTTDEQFSWSDCGFSNATYDELYLDQRLAATTEEREAIIWQMQEILHEELPYIPYVYYSEVDALRNDKVDVNPELLGGASGIAHKAFGLNATKIGEPNVVTVGSIYFTDSINPFASYHSIYIEKRPWIWDYLYNIDHTDTAVPNLATGYEVSLDGKTWNITIRDDAVFPGDPDDIPLTAETVAWSYNYCMADAEVGYGIYWAAVNSIESVNATGDWEVIITLSEPLAEDWVIYNILAGVPIFPKHLWEGIDPADAWLEEDLDIIGVGSGPFQLTDYEVDQYFELTAKEWAKSELGVQIDTVISKKYAEAAIMYEDLKAGTIEGVRFLDKKVISALEEYEEIDIYEQSPVWLDEIIICSYEPAYRKDEGTRTKWPHPALEDKAVRYALQWALDAEGAAEVAYGAWGIPACQFLGPYFGDYSHTELVCRDFSLTQAAAILDAAGYLVPE